MCSLRQVAAVAVIVLAAGLPARGQEYRVQRGDTLWDLSGRFWNDPATWPELWALNPHIRNPHWIFPGDPIYLRRPEPSARLFRLPLERLEPAGPAPGGTAGARETGQDGGPRRAGPPAAGGPVFRLARHQSEDFVASHPIPRLGTVRNRTQAKVAYAQGEDVEIELAAGTSLAPGERVTAFHDGEPVVHPVTGQPAGYYVRVLGHLVIREVSGGRAVARVVESYDTIQNGAGVMPYRPPVEAVPVKTSSLGVEGVILRGQPDRSVFGTEDVIFVDRGFLHGLEPGVVLEVPVEEGERDAQGAVDLSRPIARAVVVRVEDKAAAAVLMEARATVEPGDRFLTAAVSP